MPVTTASEVTDVTSELFDRLYVPGAIYRSTGVILGMIEEDSAMQYDLFKTPERIEQFRRLGGAIDGINSRMGKHTVFLASGLNLNAAPGNRERDEPCWRRKNLLAGETRRKRIAIPRLDIKV